jgi:uncharacterized membrane protein YqjE
MTGPAAPQRETLTDIVRRFAALAIELIALHIQSAKNELADSLDQLKFAVILLTVAVALLVMAAVIGLVVLVVGLAALTGFPAWATGLILIVIFLAIAGFLAWRGIRRLSNVTFIPEKTIASLTEEVEWLQNSISQR